MERIVDNGYRPAKGLEVLYFAGGCFWGMEKAFRFLDGVVGTVVGYANGHTQNPTYKEVCTDTTGFRECVRVTFDPKVTSTKTLLEAFFICINPEQADGQGNDIGSQYLTGVYYQPIDGESEMKATLEAIFYEKRSQYGRFYTEIGELQNFFGAEEYHQSYLEKNPTGYCHVTRAEFDAVKALNGR